MYSYRGCDTRVSTNESFRHPDDAMVNGELTGVFWGSVSSEVTLLKFFQNHKIDRIISIFREAMKAAYSITMHLAIGSPTVLRKCSVRFWFSSFNCTSQRCLVFKHRIDLLKWLKISPSIDLRIIGRGVQWTDTPGRLPTATRPMSRARPYSMSRRFASKPPELARIDAVFLGSEASYSSADVRQGGSAWLHSAGLKRQQWSLWWQQRQYTSSAAKYCVRTLVEVHRIGKAKFSYLLWWERWRIQGFFRKQRRWSCSGSLWGSYRTAGGKRRAGKQWILWCSTKWNWCDDWRSKWTELFSVTTKGSQNSKQRHTGQSKSDHLQEPRRAAKAWQQFWWTDLLGVASEVNGRLHKSRNGQRGMSLIQEDKTKARERGQGYFHLRYVNHRYTGRYGWAQNSPGYRLTASLAKHKFVIY